MMLRKSQLPQLFFAKIATQRTSFYGNRKLPKYEMADNNHNDP
jgi:hypothetical protein